MASPAAGTQRRKKFGIRLFCGKSAGQPGVMVQLSRLTATAHSGQ